MRFSNTKHKKPLNIYTDNGFHIIREADGDMSARKYIECECSDTSHIMCLEVNSYRWGDMETGNAGINFDFSLSSVATRDPFLNSFWNRLKECWWYLMKEKSYGLYYNVTIIEDIDKLIADIESAKQLMTKEWELLEKEFKKHKLKPETQRAQAERIAAEMKGAMKSEKFTERIKEWFKKTFKRK